MTVTAGRRERVPRAGAGRAATGHPGPSTGQGQGLPAVHLCCPQRPPDQKVPTRTSFSETFSEAKNRHRLPDISQVNSRIHGMDQHLPYTLKGMSQKEPRASSAADLWLAARACSGPPQTRPRAPKPEAHFWPLLQDGAESRNARGSQPGQSASAPERHQPQPGAARAGAVTWLATLCPDPEGQAPVQSSHLLASSSVFTSGLKQHQRT